eukprot:TRINITY_DN23567_c0_g1_i1.p1 TRINITY_DN23567_c0_g1~~TRINITY_DN23567_c0_g1_i1.p1  ORF type:complete len:161 (-),score=52.68 TRINITY_DN23567_c0_g1_i1:67-549(-)
MVAPSLLRGLTLVARGGHVTGQPALSTGILRSAPAPLAAHLPAASFQVRSCGEAAKLYTEEEVEDFWRRRYKKVKRSRARMHQQVNAAHDQLRLFYDMGRAKLVAKGKLHPEDAEKFARIDERLAALQMKPEKLEFFDRKKQFHNEWLDKHFDLKKGQKV